MSRQPNTHFRGNKTVDGIFTSPRIPIFAGGWHNFNLCNPPGILEYLHRPRIRRWFSQDNPPASPAAYFPSPTFVGALPSTANRRALAENFYSSLTQLAATRVADVNGDWIKTVNGLDKARSECTRHAEKMPKAPYGSDSILRGDGALLRIEYLYGQ